MAKKEKSPDLPNMSGQGVERLEIPSIDKAIDKYQSKKEARCKASPGEIAAKQDLAKLLHEHREKLPVNGEGVPFYRYEDRDYLLTESLQIKKVETDPDSE